MSQVDKLNRDYQTLLDLQRSELRQWEKVLRPSAFKELKDYVDMLNGPADPAELEACRKSKNYKAGGLHSVPVGCELHHFVMGIGAPDKATSVTDGSELL